MGCVLKNGKLPENCRKIAGKLPEKKRKFQKTEMDGSVFQISVFFKFAFFFRQFSGNFPFFKNAIRFLLFIFFKKKRTKNGKKTEILKNGNGRISYSILRFLSKIRKKKSKKQHHIDW